VDELERVSSQRGWLSRQPQPFRAQFNSLGQLVTLQHATPFLHTGDGSGGVYGIVSGGVAVLRRPVTAPYKRGFAAQTAQTLSRSIFSAVLPNTTSRKLLWPRVPTATRSAFTSAANSRTPER
jgi:hypothetical protein